MLSQPYSKWAVTNVQCNLRWTCAAGRDAHTSCCLLSFACMLRVRCVTSQAAATVRRLQSSFQRASWPQDTTSYESLWESSERAAGLQSPQCFICSVPESLPMPALRGAVSSATLHAAHDDALPEALLVPACEALSPMLMDCYRHIAANSA